MSVSLSVSVCVLAAGALKHTYHALPLLCIRLVRLRNERKGRRLCDFKNIFSPSCLSGQEKIGTEGGIRLVPGR